ncbi:MAG TPA: type II secretion system protein GspG [bacterium]|nr:type II secretion system protein GspG [bacterium]HQQ01269.1 type II secretion system protein GspG [bacterium]
MKPAFSVIELLLVAGIISIIVAIAVPNYLDAKVRAQVTQVRLDLNRVEGALNFYFLDTNRFPPLELGLRELEKGPWLGGRPAYDRFKEDSPNPFPSKYLDYGFVDAREARSLTSGQWMGKSSSSLSQEITQDEKKVWVVSSVGPERVITLTGSNLPTPYDPTNGILSPGKIYRVGQP